VEVPPCFLLAIEQTAASTWLRDSVSLFGFWFVLSLHAIGMAMLVGGSALVSLRILGVARMLPLAPFVHLYQFIWAGFWLQIVSGVALLLAYPTKSLTNIDFYVKLALIALGMLAMVRLKSHVLDRADTAGASMPDVGRRLAAAALCCWIAAIASGRLLAYTATHTMHPGC
jgi:hypothetical protein